MGSRRISRPPASPRFRQASIARPTVEGKLSGRSLRLRVSGWQGRARPPPPLLPVSGGTRRELPRGGQFPS
eukprot:12115493-Alexandrium_andersonii.AAC.1